MIERPEIDEHAIDAVIKDYGGEPRSAIRGLWLYILELQEKVRRLQSGEPERGFGGMLLSELDRKISTIEHSVFCTECFHCLRRTAQPADIVKSFTKGKDITLREWAAAQRCRCGQPGVSVALRDTRDARNWIRER